MIHAAAQEQRRIALVGAMRLLTTRYLLGLVSTGDYRRYLQSMLYDYQQL